MDDEYLRRYEHQEFARGVDREQVRQNKRIADLEATVRQINDLTLSVQKLAINMENMLVNQTEQSKRLEELENEKHIYVCPDCINRCSARIRT